MPDEDLGDSVVLSVDPEDEGEDIMAEQIAEAGNVQIALTAMANHTAQSTQEFGAASSARVRRADQIALDSSSMWAIAMTSPTVMTAQGIRMASEAGSGRSRVESNSPASAQTTGG